jgi:endonuclease/exonuclease/phosphatase family metal-dependent hydrolase
VRGLIRDHKHVQLGPHSRCLIARVRVQDREMTAVIVDLEADPFHSRHEAFARLENLLAEQAGEPLVVMGDFNTPLDSVHFDSWKRRLQHAFLTAGTGLPETWPVPLPVLALDHVWVSSDLTVTRCEKRRHPPLDHTGLRVGFAW